MKAAPVQVNDLLRRLSPNPLVHKYPNTDHAFARYGGLTYRKPDADRALEPASRLFSASCFRSGTPWLPPLSSMNAIWSYS
jgi:hypothetical protein